MAEKSSPHLEIIVQTISYIHLKYDIRVAYDERISSWYYQRKLLVTVYNQMTLSSGYFPHVNETVVNMFHSWYT